jgi:hypothetical protein
MEMKSCERWDHSGSSSLTSLRIGISDAHWIRFGNTIHREVDSIGLGFATMAFHSRNDGGSRPGSVPPMSSGIVTYHRHG